MKTYNDNQTKSFINVFGVGYSMGLVVGYKVGSNTWDGFLPPDFDSYDFPKSSTIETFNCIEIKDGPKLVLNWPIIVDIIFENDSVIVSNKDLNIHGHGGNKDEALEDFKESFLHFWRYYSKIGDDKILGYAKRLKSLFSALVKQ